MTSFASLPVSATQTVAIVSGIPPGTYFVHLVATNASGSSAASNAVTVIVAGPQPPGPPTLGAASIGPARVVSLSWVPDAGGTPTSYVVRARWSAGGPVIAILPVSGTSIAVSAPPGAYFVTVVAENAFGASSESNMISVVVP